MEPCAVFDSKGELLATGATGIVELLATGEVTKSPWPGEDEALCRKDMKTEAQIYRRIKERIGLHERFVQCIAFDEVTATLTLEYMRKGTLRDYLLSPDTAIEYEQRYQWALAAAEGLELLHSIDVVHCDFSPKNMLLNSNLALKVADFGCSSIDGSPSTGGGSVRFYPDPKQCPNWKTKHDIFALGSTIYEIYADKPPFHDLPSSRVDANYQMGSFPDLDAVRMPSEMRQIIKECWSLGPRDASSIRDMIARVEKPRQSNWSQVLYQKWETAVEMVLMQSRERK